MSLGSSITYGINAAFPKNTVYAYANDIEQFIGFVTGRGITDWALPQAGMAAYVEMLGSRGYAISKPVAQDCVGAIALPVPDRKRVG